MAYPVDDPCGVKVFDATEHLVEDGYEYGYTVDMG